MKKIGIVGAGQAGQRIAVALNSFEDVEVSGIVDPVNGKSVLADPKSKWFIEGVNFYENDDEMISQGYDGLVIAADPINVIHPMAAEKKIAMLARNNVVYPILWERPLGFEKSHPEEVENTVPSKFQSIVSFSRYGLPEKVIGELLRKDSFGDIIDFEIYLTLNCGLATKKWRHIGEMGVTQPVHLLDNAFEQIEGMGLGTITDVTSKRFDVTRNGISFDEKWEINVNLSNGISGRIIGVQYIGDSEFLYGLRSLKILGTSGAFVSTLGASRYIDSSGREHPVSISSFGIDPRIINAINTLEEFFRDRDAYPKKVSCFGEAFALSECLRTWIDSLGSGKPVSEHNLASPKDALRTLSLAESVIESAKKASV